MITVFEWMRSVPATLSFGLLPATCLLCGAVGERSLDLCAGCLSDLPQNEPACATCALPLPHASDACGVCLRRPPAFAAAFAAYRYAYPLDGLIQRLKFGGDLAAGRVLATLLARSLPQDWPAMDVLVPLPLARGRLRARGGNQTHELARALPWPMDRYALRRVRETEAQTHLDAAERKANVRNAFLADARVKGRAVVLLDDVITTGATVRSAARALRRAGAREVRVLAVARAPRRTGPRTP